jgi:hypothetical protein
MARFALCPYSPWTKQGVSYCWSFFRPALDRHFKVFCQKSKYRTDKNTKRRGNMNERAKMLIVVEWIIRWVEGRSPKVFFEQQANFRGGDGFGPK